VVGGGIAGCGAAFSLHKSGFDVEIYEKKPTIGGNGKVMEWDVEGEKVRTGLSVLAWPEELFHTYNSLVEDLKVPSEMHDLRYFISEKTESGMECVFAHGRDKVRVWVNPTANANANANPNTNTNTNPNPNQLGTRIHLGETCLAERGPS